MSDANGQKNALPTVVISSAVVLAIGAGVYLMSQKPEASENTTPENAATDTTTGTTTDHATHSEYKDGTYTAVGNYISPGGAETIGITLTLADGIITDASAEVQATIPFSVNMQNAFASGFKSIIIGKSLDEVSLDKVSGSSLTPIGFNDAVEKIKVEAQS